VTPESLPFLTDIVGKTKKRREMIRIFVAAILSSIFAALSSSAHAANIPKFVLIMGIPFGLLLVVVRQVIPKIRMPSIGLAILFRAAAYTLVFLAAIGLVFAAIVADTGATIDKASAIKTILIVLVISYFWMILVLGLRGVARKLGPGAFWQWIRGYYYTPKEEERIFMFLDMRRSTELAETLGDLKFSKLVRDFFDDLTGPIIETRAEVSHYIGDEAVITWWPKQGLQNANCLQIFFRMQAVIDGRRAYYLKQYGVVPEFKAGAHIGRVVATEVGSIKSEIVFHGDVINTTARVQSSCAQFGANLLITQALAERLPRESWLELARIGGVALKGKSEKVQLLTATVRSR
jgi:adenylate cyclase